MMDCGLLVYDAELIYSLKMEVKRSSESLVSTYTLHGVAHQQNTVRIYEYTTVKASKTHTLSSLKYCLVCHIRSSLLYQHSCLPEET
jgi:hypothetical protein